MEKSRAREEINFGPQKELETRTTTLTVAKPQDHLNCQVSRYDAVNYENNIPSVPYVAGRLKKFLSVWQTITSDSFVLDVIKGVKKEFANRPKQTVTLKEYNFNETEVKIIDMQIKKISGNWSN